MGVYSQTTDVFTFIAESEANFNIIANYYSINEAEEGGIGARIKKILAAIGRFFADAVSFIKNKISEISSKIIGFFKKHIDNLKGLRKSKAKESTSSASSTSSTSTSSASSTSTISSLAKEEPVTAAPAKEEKKAPDKITIKGYEFDDTILFKHKQLNDELVDKPFNIKLKDIGTNKINLIQSANGDEIEANMRYDICGERAESNEKMKEIIHRNLRNGATEEKELAVIDLKEQSVLKTIDNYITAIQDDIKAAETVNTHFKTQLKYCENMLKSVREANSEVDKYAYNDYSDPNTIVKANAYLKCKMNTANIEIVALNEFMNSFKDKIRQNNLVIVELRKASDNINGYHRESAYIANYLADIKLV